LSVNDSVALPGLLSPLLARLRHGRAERLIPDGHRSGRILDVGCGAWPAFLVRTRFTEKHGVDRRAASAPPPPDVSLYRLDVRNGGLPWPDGHFDVVTMLAVLEHFEASAARCLLREANRLLRSRGVVVLTVPSRQGEALLHVLSPLGITSREQHEEHQEAYDTATLRSALEQAGFAPEETEVGRFELGLGLWARAWGGGSRRARSKERRSPSFRLSWMRTMRATTQRRVR
jgi:SAM-dependent methyltransferase